VSGDDDLELENRLEDPLEDELTGSDSGATALDFELQGGLELRFEAGAEDAGRRVDVVLSGLAGVPRAQVRRWIEAGVVRLNEEAPRSSRKVCEGDLLVARPPQPAPVEAQPEPIPLDVLYSDLDLIVINKAAGMVVHPAPGHASGTLVNALLHHCDDLAGVGGAIRPGIVHRLDRGTSGVMVAAKNDAAHHSLSAQFHEHTIERTYWAFVRSLPRLDAGVIDQPIGRHPRDRKRMSVRTESGREARSHWSVLRRYPESATSWLEIRPDTGRTHQIRVHLSSQGMPIAGDPVYGRRRSRRRSAGPGTSLERPALHAARLGFIHPRSGERLRFDAPLPPDLAAFQRELERREGIQEA
jgi:23S rRNA pseudouridine1911/1915/1917 synthase